MSCFKFPDNLLEDIERITRNFWWDDKDKRKIHWLRWEALCESKMKGGLGFRSLKAFNLALLAKQAWRIITNPNSTLSRMYKAKYFPNTSFFDAKCGTHSSFTWKCIWSTRDVISAGMRWRIGNGNQVKIWGDKWIPRPLSFRILTPPADHDLRDKVSSLIDYHTGQWNYEILAGRFWKEDVDAILSIPLGDPRNCDRMVWHYNSNGLFSVRSAYRLIMEQGLDKKKDRGESSNREDRNWTFIWRLKVPNKIKIFIWRACRDILPSKTNLKKKGILIDQQCDLCGFEAESAAHTLSDCHFARQTWALSNIPHSILATRSESIEVWVKTVTHKLSLEDAGRFACICWALWWKRNNFNNSNNHDSPYDVCNFANRFYKTYLNANIRLPTAQPEAHAEWVPPPVSFIKINYDGAIFTKESEHGLGVIARDNNGVCLAWKKRRLKGLLNPEVVEVLAAKLAVEMAAEFRWQYVIIEGDCINVTRALEQNTGDLSAHGNVLEDILRIAGTILTVKFVWTCRERNVDAHQLARSARNNMSWVLQQITT